MPWRPNFARTNLEPARKKGRFLFISTGPPLDPSIEYGYVHPLGILPREMMDCPSWPLTNAWMPRAYESRDAYVDSITC